MTSLDDAIDKANKLASELKSHVSGNPTGKVLLPGENQDQAALRRIKMHEFLMTGGIEIRREKGTVTYSESLTVLDALEIDACPWHGADCEPWEAIKAGNGHWTKLESELEELTAVLRVRPAAGQPVPTKEMWDRYNQLREDLSMRPRDLQSIRDRTDAQFERERDAALRKQLKEDNAKYRATNPQAKKTGGNPWDRPGAHNPRSGYGGTSASSGRGSGKPVGSSGYSYAPPPAKDKDTRLAEAAAFLNGGEVPDEIVIDGDEGEGE